MSALLTNGFMTSGSLENDFNQYEINDIEQKQTIISSGDKHHLPNTPQVTILSIKINTS
jgi:hypothetical protein